MDQQDTNSPARQSQNPTGPVMDVQAPPAPAAASQPAASTPTATPAVSTPTSPHKKGKTPFGVMFVAVLVGLGLCGLTVFAYLKTKDAPTVRDNQNAATTQQKASAKDVDETTKGIDESMKSLDDAADFNDADLSDSNLGL